MNVDFEPGRPCGYCGVRPDFPCKHRAIAAPSVERPEIKPDGRKTRNCDGNGHNFHRRKSVIVKEDLGEIERAWLKATPLEGGLSAGKIVRRANGKGTPSMFGAFASKRQELFERVRDGHNCYSYVLSEEGRQLRATLEESKADAKP